MSHHLRAFTIFCVFGAILSLIRIYITGSLEYAAFVWNLILALLPYFFAGIFVEKSGLLKWTAFFLWIIFFPNSLYILTDFVHLPEHPEMLHFDIVFISTVALAGLFAGYASLEIIHTYWNKHFHKKIAWLGVSIVLILSVFGVYIGRFLRFNSWDIILHPWSLFQEIWMMIITDGRSLLLGDALRSFESEQYSGGSMSLMLFMVIYSLFFFLLYVFVYHTRRVR